MHEAVRMFIEYRAEKGYPLTTTALKLTLRRLALLDVDSAIAELEYAITHNFLVPYPNEIHRETAPDGRVVCAGSFDRKRESPAIAESGVMIPKF